jgi:hypothetical protein
MALTLNAEVKNSEGFSTDNCLIFVAFNFDKGGNYARLEYYRTKEDFKDQKNQFYPIDSPLNFELTIPKNVFWGSGNKGLIETIHIFLKNQLENIFGKNTVTIIQDPYN